MFFEWYHWAIGGILLSLAELLIPAFIVVWFGCGALAVAALLLLIPDASLTNQFLTWAMVSLALTFLWFKFFKPLQVKTLSGRSSAHVVGEVGLIVTPVEPFQKGSIRFQTPIMGSSVWDCVADESLIPGTRAKIVSVEGSILKITKEKS